MTWRDEAACKGRVWPSPGLEDRRPRTSRTQAAVQYCRGCTVVAECAQDARNFGDVDVVRAGIYLYSNGGDLSANSRAALDDIVSTAHGYDLRRPA